MQFCSLGLGTRPCTTAVDISLLPAQAFTGFSFLDGGEDLVKLLQVAAVCIAVSFFSGPGNRATLQLKLTFISLVPRQLTRWKAW